MTLFTLPALAGRIINIELNKRLATKLTVARAMELTTQTQAAIYCSWAIAAANTMPKRRQTVAWNRGRVRSIVEAKKIGDHEGSPIPVTNSNLGLVASAGTSASRCRKLAGRFLSITNGLLTADLAVRVGRISIRVGDLAGRTLLARWQSEHKSNSSQGNDELLHSWKGFGLIGRQK